MNVLVLCTGNSARSILGEVLINALGGGRFTAYSAGSHPAGQVNPGALRKLREEGHSTDGLASKSWDAFDESADLVFDLIITVCDNAAGESCPVWNGAPVTAHWGIADPASAVDSKSAFDLAYTRLERRVRALVKLPVESLDDESLAEALAAIHAIAEVRDDAD